MLKNHEIQKYDPSKLSTIIIFNFLILMFRELNVSVDLLSPDMMKKKFPWLNVDDIELGSYGSLNSGW